LLKPIKILDQFQIEINIQFFFLINIFLSQLSTQFSVIINIFIIIYYIYNSGYNFSR
jgi:hypothetical protein